MLPANLNTTIYGIRCKEDQLFRWVGRTKVPLKDRFNGHACSSDGTLYEWIKERGRKNVEIVKLGEGTAAEEKELITQYAAEGHPLMNKQYLHGWPRKRGKQERVGIWR